MSGDPSGHRLSARRLGIDTHFEAVVFLHKQCPVCRSEGFVAHRRVLLRAGDKHIIATLYQIDGPLLGLEEAGLSDSAWERLGLIEGGSVVVSHHDPIDSLGLVRSRIYGQPLPEAALRAIVGDIVDGKYSDIHISSFITACATKPLNPDEVHSLTRAMVDVGERLHWGRSVVVDKHSVGGLPGNRTTPIVVAIATALGLTMPKTSSRAITSPAGTADTMEVLAPVDLDVAAIHRVVEQEGGCIVWGGAVRLSPADDILIRVERALDIDTEGQLIASVMSKKIAAGATHLVLDVPIGETTKVRSEAAARSLNRGLLSVAAQFGIKALVVTGDGREPIGRGIGPALEAEDVLDVLQCRPGAPGDLRSRALALAGPLLELVGIAQPGEGQTLAARTLDDGRAWAKFQRICEAQGGMRKPGCARYREPVLAKRSGRLLVIDNRKISRLAKLAGAPESKSAGIRMCVQRDAIVVAGEPLCMVHSDASGELGYAMGYADSNPDIFRIEDV